MTKQLDYSEKARDFIKEAYANSGRIDSRIRFTCRLCEGRLVEALDLGETPLANELPTHTNKPQDLFPLYLSRCVDCQHVQLPVVVNPERLFRDYVYQSGTSPVFVKHLQEFARNVQPKRDLPFAFRPCRCPSDDIAKGIHYNECVTSRGEPGGLVVEIGSNDGTLLSEYQHRGFSVLGIDPAHNMADIAEAKRVPTIRAFFGRATLSNWNLAGRKADLVVALNVFAHSDELIDMVEGVSLLLADDGEFVIECGYLPSMVAGGVYRVIYHEHLAYWHAGAMSSFLMAHGLNLYDAERVPTQGGSMRYFASKVPRSQSESLRAILAAETAEALDVSRLAKNIAEDRAELRGILDAAHAEGKTVCGYGCPAQLTTTAYALGLTHGDIAFVVDDNPLKVGKYTPGLFWPIVPTSALIDKAPDLCVIFSANFATDIINRHPDFAGEWVIP